MQQHKLSFSLQYECPPEGKHFDAFSIVVNQRNANEFAKTL